METNLSRREKDAASQRERAKNAVSRRAMWGNPLIKVAAIAVSAAFSSGAAQAYTFDTDADWKVNFDNSPMYTMGWRAQGQNPAMLNSPLFHQSESIFGKGDMVTNRLQNLVELQAIYQDKFGARVTGSFWKDFAYTDHASGNPDLLAAGYQAYPGGDFTSHTKRFHVEGAELLDAFIFGNTKIGDTPVSAKLGRLTAYWGNAFYFGFTNIAYSQAGVDNIKGFSQPGSELKELFLPRKQVLLSADISPELSVAAQYIFEFASNRYPEAGTYFSAADFLYTGPKVAPALGLTGYGTAGNEHKPKDNNQNFGVKVAWSPAWLGGDLGFYFRQFDEAHPNTLFNPSAPGSALPYNAIYLDYAQKVKLYGVSLEKTFGPVSTGYEVSYRKDTSLNNGGLSFANPKGDLVNVIANALVTLSSNPVFDTGSLIAELSYTRLTKVTQNESSFAGCYRTGGDINSGCSTKNATALWVMFEPTWLQVFPGVDISMPSSYAWGAKGNPAYAAGGFYAQNTGIYNIGVKALVDGKHSVALSYNGLHWGPNGAPALSQRDWVSLTFKTSF